MKTSEFIKRVEEMGYEVEGDGYICKGSVFKGRVSLEAPLLIDTVYAKMSEELFDLIVEYAKTPLEEREEEKKYYIRPKGMDFGVEFAMMYQTNTKKWGSHYKKSVWHTDKEQTQFTLKELEDLGIDIEHYDLEEIE